jgi:hypothetical protein
MCATSLVPVEVQLWRVDYLVKKYFTKLALEQQLKIESDGTPMPKLQLRVDRKRGYRTLNEENYVH